MRVFKKIFVLHKEKKKKIMRKLSETLREQMIFFVNTFMKRGNKTVSHLLIVSSLPPHLIPQTYDS